MVNSTKFVLLLVVFLGLVLNVAGYHKECNIGSRSVVIEPMRIVPAIGTIAAMSCVRITLMFIAHATPINNIRDIVLVRVLRGGSCRVI